jgi:hypothetical protein
MAGGVDSVQSTPANTVAKCVMSSFGIVNNQREKQTMLQVVQKIPLFWKAIGQQVVELPNAYEVANPQGWGSQSKTTTQSGLVKACSEQNESTTQTVCLRVFYPPASTMNFLANSGSNGGKRCCHPLTLRGHSSAECGGSIEGRRQRVATIFIVIRDVQTKLMRSRLWD